MDISDKFLQNNNLQGAEDIDGLLESASLLRQLISSRRYAGINTLIKYTIEHDYIQYNLVFIRT